MDRASPHLADELVTKQFLRAELAELRLAMAEGFRRQTTMLGAGLAAAVAVLGSLEALL